MQALNGMVEYISGLKQMMTNGLTYLLRPTFVYGMRKLKNAKKCRTLNTRNMKNTVNWLLRLLIKWHGNNLSENL